MGHQALPFVARQCGKQAVSGGSSWQEASAPGLGLYSEYLVLR
jgi:hypothetical protein